MIFTPGSYGPTAYVATATGNGAILVRDTTDRDGDTLAFTASAWQAFAGSLK
jgi:hypothetical protein